MYDLKTLQTTIAQLISVQHEGDYWDFKRRWHKNLADLLHDILCLANSSTTTEKYLIIGAGESNKRKSFSVVGVKQNDANRKDSKDLNDFLSTVSFVGDIRPMVHVRQVVIDGRKLDVIIVEPSKNTPFVLAEDYVFHPEKGKPTTIHCGHVYTRIGDKNTPKDRTADNDKVEALWRRRFRLDSTPTERLSYYLLRPDEWEIVNSTDDDVIVYYYKYAPEYRIEFEDCNSEARNGDFLCKGWINGPSVYYSVTFRLFETPSYILMGYVAFTNRLFGTGAFYIFACAPLQIHGFVSWSRNLEHTNVKARKFDFKVSLLVITSCIIGSLVVGFLLSLIPSQQLSLLDAASNCVNLCGIILMNLRYMEAWWLWLVNNILDLSIWSWILFTGEGNGAVMMFITCIMYLLINVYGIYKWIKSSKASFDNEARC